MSIGFVVQELLQEMCCYEVHEILIHMKVMAIEIITSHLEPYCFLFLMPPETPINLASSLQKWES